MSKSMSAAVLDPLFSRRAKAYRRWNEGVSQYTNGAGQRNIKVSISRVVDQFSKSMDMLKDSSRVVRRSLENNGYNASINTELEMVRRLDDGRYVAYGTVRAVIG